MLDAPLSSAINDNAIIFPSAILLLEIGVISIVAIVPRSFSPAIDSVPTAIHALKRKTSRSIGIIIDITIPVVSSFVATSYVPLTSELTSNLLAICDSYISRRLVILLNDDSDSVDDEL